MAAILIVPADSRAKNVNDLIEAAKAKPNGLNYSSAGVGSATDSAFEVLLQTAGIQMTHVPYKGMPESQSSVIRGDSAAGFTFFSGGGELIKAGKMRNLAVTGKTRLEQLPDVPTVTGRADHLVLYIVFSVRNTDHGLKSPPVTALGKACNLRPGAVPDELSAIADRP